MENLIEKASGTMTGFNQEVFDKVRQARDTISETVDRFEHELTLALSHKEYFRGQVITLENENARLKGQNAGLNDRVNQLEAVVSKDKVDGYQASLEAKDKEIVELANRVVVRNIRINKLENELGSLKAHYELRADRIAELEKEVKNLQHDYETQATACENQRRNSEYLNKQNDKLRYDYDYLMRCKDVQVSNNAALEKTNKELREAHQCLVEIIKEKSEESGKLRAELDDRKATMPIMRRSWKPDCPGVWVNCLGNSFDVRESDLKQGDDWFNSPYYHYGPLPVLPEKAAPQEAPQVVVVQNVNTSVVRRGIYDDTKGSITLLTQSGHVLCTCNSSDWKVIK